MKPFISFEVGSALLFITVVISRWQESPEGQVCLSPGRVIPVVASAAESAVSPGPPGADDGVPGGL